MNAEFVFRTACSPSLAHDGVRLFFLGAGYVQVDDSAGVLCFQRGSGLRRMTSLKVERWPTTLRVVLLEVAPDQATGVLLRYEVKTGLHLVGALDRAVLEAEAALLEDHLATGRRRDLGEAVAPLRRPVLTATCLNMLLAVLVIAWIGVVGEFPVAWVIVAAAVIAFLDGVVIMAFADLLVEGGRRVPRLVDSEASPGRVSEPRVPSESA